jgi:TolA-binding protein
MLGAGDSWVADAPLDTLAPAATASTVLTQNAALSRAFPKPLTTASRSVTESAKEFRDAVELLNAGNFVASSAALRTYLARHPATERAEDATYLLVLALHRSGDAAGADAAARDYLRLYPHGLRRKEIERLAPAAAASR